MFVNESHALKSLKRLEDFFCTLTNIGGDLEEYLYTRKKKAIMLKKVTILNKISTFLYKIIFLFFIFLLIIYLYYHYVFVRKLFNIILYIFVINFFFNLP